MAIAKLRFSDGINIDTSGPLRKLKLPDGWYVVGNGLLFPVNSEVEANQTLEDLKGIGDRKEG